jgi:hypothetical protein
MFNLKYFYKGHNHILDRLITLLFTLAGILSFFVSPSYSLGWNDEEWLQSGCPQTVSGEWAADNLETTDIRFLSINNSEVIFTSKSDKTYKYEISKSYFNSNNQYVKVKPVNNQNEAVLKIRPHLIQMDSQKEINNPRCLIKVFTYKNERHAMTDRYSGWNIFRLLKK